MKTTYILGAGASKHAGFPLTFQLWNCIKALPASTDVVAPVSPVSAALRIEELLGRDPTNLEQDLTDLKNSTGPFCKVQPAEAAKLLNAVRDGLHKVFLQYHQKPHCEYLYDALASNCAPGDSFLTFNYDLLLEKNLLRHRKFAIRNGYGFLSDWETQQSPTEVLKLHGSINWLPLLFDGGQGYAAFTNALGPHPWVDNLAGILSDLPRRVLDRRFPGGGGLSCSTTMILPTLDKEFWLDGGYADEFRHFYQSLWLAAARHLGRADKIVVIGYSMPDADHRARGLILHHANKFAAIELCSGEGANFRLRHAFESAGFLDVRMIGTFEDLFPAARHCDLKCPSCTPPLDPMAG